MAINWQIRFRDLPEIPLSKRWIQGKNFTKEQSIISKLQKGQKLTDDDIFSYLESKLYYEALAEKLKALNYSSFAGNDFDNFRNYIAYAFCSIAVINDDLSVSHVVRLVVNEKVHTEKKNTRLDNISYLKYPSLDLIKKRNIYNRTNTCNSTMFYAAIDINTALKEIRPELNKLVTVTRWTPSNPKKTFSTYNIFFNENIVEKNQAVRSALKNFNELYKKHAPLYVDFLKPSFQLLGHEFTKNVKHPYEYLVSAILSEQLMKSKVLVKNSFECIRYPSVGNSHLTDNLAIRPDVLDEHFKIDHIMEFEVEEQFYDNPLLLNEAQKMNQSEDIIYAKIKNICFAKRYYKNGKIEWG